MALLLFSSAAGVKKEKKKSYSEVRNQTNKIITKCNMTKVNYAGEVSLCQARQVFFPQKHKSIEISKFYKGSVQIIMEKKVYLVLVQGEEILPTKK